MKKKILLISLVAFVFLLTGCASSDETPSKAVENFLSKYQSMDQEVLTQLDEIVSNDETLTDDARLEYKSLMERQYQNLSYKIKNEKIEKDTAEVDVEIEVFDYENAIDKAKEYYDENKDEFTDDNGSIDDSKYMDYKIKEMKNVADKKKEEITFIVKKEDGLWKVQNLSQSDIQKIHGLYDD